MKSKEPMLQFSPACVLADKVTLVLPSEFSKLVGRNITGCHLFMLVIQGKLQAVVNGKEHEMAECSLLDMMDWADFHVSHVSADLRAYCLLPGREFTNESLANFKPCPDSYLVNRFLFSGTFAFETRM